MAREYTKEEVREQFLSRVEVITRYWDRVEDMTSEEKLEGLAFSIMNIFDGTSSLPAFDIVVKPHPEDKEYLIAEGENYYQDGMVINDDVMLHELIFKKR